MTAVSTILRTSRRLIGTRPAWSKGVGVNPKPTRRALCAVMSVSHAARGLPESDAAVRALAAAVPFSEYLPGMRTPRQVVIDFNDHPSTCHADILALHDRAIALLESQPHGATP